MYVLWQVAEGERRRIRLEKSFPGLVVLPILFPVSKRRSKWNVTGTVDQYVGARMQYLRRVAVLAVSWKAWMEALSVFARWGMSGDGASHATNGLYIVS